MYSITQYSTAQYSTDSTASQRQLRNKRHHDRRCCYFAARAKSQYMYSTTQYGTVQYRQHSTVQQLRNKRHHDRRDNCATNTRQCCYFAARAKSQHSKHSTAQQHGTAQHSTAQTAQHSTAQQHSQHSTVQHAKPCALKHCNRHPVANTPPGI